jgi:hypothetical protein
MNLHTPKWAPTLGIRVLMDSKKKFKRLQGSKPIGLKSSLYHWKALGYRCLKRACMTHLGTLNTSYGQNKGWESNCQFDSQLLKVKNCPNFLVLKWHAKYYWKTFNEGSDFASNLISIEGLHTKLWASKVAKVPILGNFGTPTWEFQDKMTFGCWPYDHAQRII